MSAADKLRGLALAALIAVLAWAGYALLPAAHEATSPVVIHRVMTSNPSVCYSVKGRYYDWLELVNLTDAPVSLRGWKLADTLDLREAFVFGDVTLPGRGSLRAWRAARCSAGSSCPRTASCWCSQRASG